MRRRASRLRSTTVAAQAVETARRLGRRSRRKPASATKRVVRYGAHGRGRIGRASARRGLAVTVYSGTRKGSASTTDFSPSIEDTVRKALSIGSFTAADEYAGLADAALMATEPPDLDLYFPWDVDVDRDGDGAARGERGARLDARIANSEGASVSEVGPSRVRELTRIRRRLSDEQLFHELQRRGEIE